MWPYMIAGSKMLLPTCFPGSWLPQRYDGSVTFGLPEDATAKYTISSSSNLAIRAVGQVSLVHLAWTLLNFSH